MESLSSSVDICPGGSHEHHDNCLETAEATGPAVEDICGRFKATMEQVRLLRARNVLLSEELSGVQQRMEREVREERLLLERELVRLREELEAEAEARSEAGAERLTAEAESAALRAERKALEEQLAGLQERLRASAAELGEKEGALQLARLRAELLEKERAAERETRLRLRDEADLLRAKAGSLAARVQLQEGEKRRLREELQFQRRAAEQREAQLSAGRPGDLERERNRAECAREMEVARREADRWAKATEEALRRSYEEKFQELLEAQDGAEPDLLRQHNQQLNQSLARLTEQIADLKAENEKLSLQLSQKVALEALSRRDLQAASARSRRFEAAAGRQLGAIRALMAAESEGLDPLPETRADLSEELPTLDNTKHLNWIPNAAYHKPGNTEKASKSKPGLNCVSKEEPRQLLKQI